MCSRIASIVIATVLAVTAALAGTGGATATATTAATGHSGHRDARTIRVAVLNFDPVVTSAGGQRLHTVLGWNDPPTLARAYRDEIRRASGGNATYTIAQWRDVNGFPAAVDGFRYTVEGYLAAWSAGTGFHSPDGMDYARMLTESGLISAVNHGRIDEIWLYGGPYFGYWEAAMAGPGAFYVNGGVYPDVPGLRRPVVIMGFNYERGVAEELEDFCHRIEATMTRTYGGWNLAQPVTAWDQFGRNAAQSPAPAAVGSCHYPPNGRWDYDYGNPAPVDSTAQAWLRYPRLRDRTTVVTAETWGGPDYHRAYLLWWMRHLPDARGWNPDGRLNNWWPYIVDYTAYDAQGRALRHHGR